MALQPACGSLVAFTVYFSPTFMFSSRYSHSSRETGSKLVYYTENGQVRLHAAINQHVCSSRSQHDEYASASIMLLLLVTATAAVAANLLATADVVRCYACRNMVREQLTSLSLICSAA